MQTVNISIPEGRERVRHMDGHLNIGVEERYSNIQQSICLGLPQVRGYPQSNEQEVCIVGSGPSLASTLWELQALVAARVHVVALNGAYDYLLRAGVTPNAMVLIDGRESNRRFITQPIESCHYLIASQCHPAVFEAVRSMPKTKIWHCLTGADPVELQILNGYYQGCWQPVMGGCTVGTRAIMLMRFLGYAKMHLFGMDSCYMDGEGHAMPQPENDNEVTQIVECAGRSFRCSAWQQEQALEFMDIIQEHGQYFELAVHGNGLLAHILESGAYDDPVVAKGD